MHLMEHHLVPWLRQWRQGLGLMAEQGAEAIHARINSLKPFYANITNPKDRLRLLIEAHHLQVLPVNRCIKSLKI